MSTIVSGAVGGSVSLARPRTIRCLRHDASFSAPNRRARCVALPRLVGRIPSPRRPREVGSSSSIVVGGSTRASSSLRRMSSSATSPRGDDVGERRSKDSNDAVGRARRALLEAVDGTYRGCVASAEERAVVEEAQVALEALTPGGDDLDLEALEGKWRLIYTTAADVLSVLRLQRDTGLLEVGDIFQSFAKNGKIENEIRLSVPFLLAPATQGTDGGVGLKVDADYTRVGARTLSLVFQEAKVSEVRISDAVEALVAPAILPRGSLNHQVLLAIRELELRFPLRGAVTSMVSTCAPCLDISHARAQ